jgi:hypothetical protein
VLRHQLIVVRRRLERRRSLLRSCRCRRPNARRWEKIRSAEISEPFHCRLETTIQIVRRVCHANLPAIATVAEPLIQQGFSVSRFGSPLPSLITRNPLRRFGALGTAVRAAYNATSTGSNAQVRATLPSAFAGVVLRASPTRQNRNGSPTARPRGRRIAWREKATNPRPLPTRAPPKRQSYDADRQDDEVCARRRVMVCFVSTRESASGGGGFA